MTFQLKCLKWILGLFIIFITVITVTYAVEVDNDEYTRPNILIRKLSPKNPFQSEFAINHSGLYVLWQKFLVRVSGDLKQSVLAKSFGAMDMELGHDVSPISAEQLQLAKISGEVELEKRIICAMLSFMKILLALDIVILAGVLLMLLNCFVTSKETVEDDVDKV